MTLEPLGEVGAKISLQLSSRTQFTKNNNKKVIAENQCEKHKKSSLPCLDIWYVASPSGPLSRFLKIMPLWLKMVLPRRPHVLHGIYLYRENILSETTRPKALIFGK